MKIFDPVLTCKQSNAFEKRLLGSDDARIFSAMNRAGSGAARHFLAEFASFVGRKNPIIIGLIGKGNNGGDALIMIARLVEDYFKDARVFLFTPSGRPETLNRLCRRALTESFAGIKNMKISSSLTELKSVCENNIDLIVEGLAGMNFAPPLSDFYAHTLEIANQTPAKVKVAIDIPVGIGEDFAPEREAFRADVTYSTGVAKAALFKPDNATFAGRIRYVDLDFFDMASPEDQPSELIVKERALQTAISGLRPSISDKRKYGHLFIFAGSISYPGAALLNVKSALRSGVGLVSAFVPETFAASFAAAEPSAIWVSCPVDETGALALESFSLYKSKAGAESAILMGAGVTKSPETAALMSEILKNSSAPAVLDADAISPSLFALLKDRKNSLITPHVGEFLRLKPDALDSSLLDAAKTATVLLKGHVSSVCDGERIVRSVRGCPVLSRGGSGDILSGLCGGLLARKDLSLSAMQAASLAAQWLGIASERAFEKIGQNAVATSDIVDNFIKEALKNNAD